MLIDIEKIVENIKQDPRTAYLKALGDSILAVSQNRENNSNNYHFSSADDFTRRQEFVKELHASAMEVINTLEK